MPLLRKKVFEKQSTPDFLRDDEEVFYCEITNEIFRDYQEFSERMFLCNSMVWTCSMTGKTNLTYQEALESEEHAKQSLKEFPNELKVPVLYLASITKRTSFGDMAEDVFIYAKDRYFIGESIEASFTSNKWKDCHILSVIAPKENFKKETKNGSSPERNFIPASNSYKYEIEHLDAEDSDISEIMIVDSTQLRRRKQHFSRDKCKIFLKQFTEQNDRGISVIKQSILEKFSVDKVKWEKIFDGPLPNFQSSKNFEKAMNGERKKQRQETLAKYLQKNGLVMKKDDNKEKKNDLLEQMKKREEEFKVQKKLNEEQKLAIKKEKQQNAQKLAQYHKIWMKPKEDLELEDQAKLPTGIPVKTKIPNQYFGDIITIMEFIHSFPKLLSMRDFFPGGITLDLMERALSEKEVAGPLTDIIQMFLTAIFNAQDEESSNYNTGIDYVKDINKEPSSLSLKVGIQLATLASSWATTYQGMPLGKLPLYSLTVSEILRLHLLSSGARIKETGSRWRYAQRGGYSNEDDPGLHLRMNQAYILKALAIHNVVQLPISDKITIILCLINQLLTYAEVRDVVEEKIEKTKELRLKLRTVKSEEKKRLHNFVVAKVKLKKELHDDKKALQEAMEKLQSENEEKEAESARQIQKLMKSANDGLVVMGRDRAYRRYLRVESIPGIFVFWEDEEAGICLDKPTVQYPELLTATRPQLMSHIRKVFGLVSSNKENSPEKSPKKLNGARKSLQTSEENINSELLMCTADGSTCPVHCITDSRPKWSFFHEKEQLEDLIKSLNVRGLREHELKDYLQCEEASLVNILEHTPVKVLNPEVIVVKDDTDERQTRPSNKKKDRYEDANLGYPSEMLIDEVMENILIENILEMEEKISGGTLGVLKMKDRNKWRSCLQNKNYMEFEAISQAVFVDSDKPYKGKDSRSNTPEINAKDEKEYQDPGKFLGSTAEIVPEDSDNDIMTNQSQKRKTAVQILAKALGHVAQIIDLKYLKKPLGHGYVKNNNKKYDVIEQWEESLKASTSFSQIFLHYGTLDSCIMWSKSALLAKCRICRRQNNSENMLLCDSCNFRFHRHCLKPKLTSVPKGDWFCHKCKKEKEKQERLLSPEPAPQKKRKIFDVEEADEEEEEADDDEGSEGSCEEEDEDSEEYQNGDTEIKVELCKMCSSGGELVECESCSSSYHKECVEPPLRRIPRNPWTCPSCKQISKRTRENGCYDSVKFTGFISNQRRCAARANRKIHIFIKALQEVGSNIDVYESDDSEDEVTNNRRYFKRDDSREDLPLHNAALQDLLSDVMKHEDAWPFLRPVPKNQVPDYYDIITSPMDFGTIKYKLNMGKYSTDSQLMKDVVLVFENCNTYNSSADEVYKCGVKLLKFFAKKAKEHGLKVPQELEEDEPKPKKRRIK